MPKELDPQVDLSQLTTYQIRITGQLGSRWADWFEGLTITPDGGDTLITGPVVDQAALHGLLKRVRDLGMPLVSVTPVEPAPPAERLDVPRPKLPPERDVLGSAGRRRGETP